MPELPPPEPDALALSARLEARIRDAIAAAGGCIGFDAFMQMALYEPGLGYYVNGLRKFGPGGDFTTAPERSPLFARTLARQVAQVLRAVPGGEVLEFGPGSGALAAELLAELDALGCAPARYCLLELSADLQQRQREAIAARVPHLMDRVVWLTQLPERFAGAAIANEVLDAMPVRRFCVLDGGLAEQYVAASRDGLAWVQGPPQDARLAARVAGFDLPAGYVSEVNLAAEAWVRSVCERLDAGLLLLIDYGYPRAEYYHPQRVTGTLRCHYRQQAHDDALRWPGLQDITAHVDFTAIAEAAHAAGATVAGFTTQAQFLINCGLPGLLEAIDPASPDYLDLALQARQLLLPQAMGEAFKVLGLTRGLGNLAPLGFAQGDRRHRL
ncbi:MAG: class I SAM-dependent methyltransferase [Immundisolibacter sp.]|uniref:class I SAM-dependent methyltransferase n=1 Tax=Immundisolibacter sp. TaxID=1934948 RepID=UPI003D1145C0